MKQIVLGILAHVDAGKTTLSEALLYTAGAIRRLGRVDHRDAFLDTDALERRRGITIFSKQAVLPLSHTEITLLDTPGHTDFSSETERTLRVLDCAVLVVSGTDGVQAHTRTLWQLLARYGIPTFLFVNKMDLPGTDKVRLMEQLRQTLSDGCVDFTAAKDALFEEASLTDESLLDEYLETGALTDDALARAVAGRVLFPCFFGSALRLQGVDTLLEALERYTPEPDWPEAFGARVFKISRDEQGAELTHLKITGGALRVKQMLGDGENARKIDQIRRYSGVKYDLLQQADAGTVCAVTGLTDAMPGDVFGYEQAAPPPLLEPVLSYTLSLPEGTNVHDAYGKLRQLEQEDPQLHVLWQEQLRCIQLRLMGAVQLDVLREVIARRFGLDVTFGPGVIVYKETISDTVEGVGHYEPLRHYAEVHLVLSPLPRGSGLIFDSDCSTDELERNWQRLILTHLNERTHRGVLTGSPITDMRITLASGRAHPKHTEGGDFRQATYRAGRNGLMKARSVLLEPYYDFTLSVPARSVGRALTDLRLLRAEFGTPETVGEDTVITGFAPAATIVGYASEVAAYSKGRGVLTLTLRGYGECRNADEVIAQIAYDAAADVDNSADSVFCFHGAGQLVSWDRVQEVMHLPSVLTERPQTAAEPERVIRRSVPYTGAYEQDKELQRIFERTYGSSVKGAILHRPRDTVEGTASMLAETNVRDGYVLIDGYNVIFAWPELRDVAKESFDLARRQLITMLVNFQGFTGKNVIVVFDAYKTSRQEAIEKHGGLFVVYTAQSEIADVYIEKVAALLGRTLEKKYAVQVVTSDNLEQCITLAHGALRLPARSFIEELTQTLSRLRKTIEETIS